MTPDGEKETPEARGRYAVALPDDLRGVVQTYGSLPVSDPGWRRLRSDDNYGTLRERCHAYLAEVLDAMDELPPQPPRGVELAAEDERALRAAFIPVFRSFRAVKRLAHIIATVHWLRTRTETSAKDVLKGVAKDERYRHFRSLGAYLYRRSDAYDEWAADYYARPAVVAKRRAQRRVRAAKPGVREAEAERKRIAYYTSRGLSVPPRKPKREDD